VNEAPAPAETTAAIEVAPKAKAVAKPQPQKTYSLLSEVQIAGIRDRL
jgi:hypothetical protein